MDDLALLVDEVDRLDQLLEDLEVVDGVHFLLVLQEVLERLFAVLHLDVEDEGELVLHLRVLLVDDAVDELELGLVHGVRVVGALLERTGSQFVVVVALPMVAVVDFDALAELEVDVPVGHHVAPIEDIVFVPVLLDVQVLLFKNTRFVLGAVDVLVREVQLPAGSLFLYITGRLSLLHRLLAL